METWMSDKPYRSVRQPLKTEIFMLVWMSTESIHNDRLSGVGSSALGREPFPILLWRKVSKGRMRDALRWKIEYIRWPAKGHRLLIPRRFVADPVFFCCFISCEFAVVNPTAYVQLLFFRVSVMTIITFATRSIVYFADRVQVVFPADGWRFVRFPMLHIYFLLKIWAKGKICDKIEGQSSERRKKRCFRK